uniref:Uncharacterized protein n=1 Tax=Manihot esculenta TaxID=3983 RepID=A0A2C9V8T6_MANES
MPPVSVPITISVATIEIRVFFLIKLISNLYSSVIIVMKLEDEWNPVPVKSILLSQLQGRTNGFIDIRFHGMRIPNYFLQIHLLLIIQKFINLQIFIKKS